MELEKLFLSSGKAFAVLKKASIRALSLRSARQPMRGKISRRGIRAAGQARGTFHAAADSSPASSKDKPQALAGDVQETVATRPESGNRLHPVGKGAF